MFYTAKSCKVSLNDNEIVVNAAQLSSAATLNPNYYNNQRHSFGYSAGGNVQGALKINYLLTGADYLKTFIANETGAISGNFGGLFFNSGYLTSYNVVGTPHSPVEVSAVITFFESITGNFTPAAMQTAFHEYLTFNDVTISTLAGYNTETFTNIDSINYSFSSDVRPVYSISSTTGLTTLTPDRVTFGQKQIVTEIVSDNLTGYLPFRGKDVGLQVNFNHPNKPLLSENLLCSGTVFEKNLNVNSNDILKSSFSVTQHNINNPPTIVGFVPTSANPDDTVLILGTNLDNLVKLKLADQEITNYTTYNSTTVGFHVPLDARTGPIFVKTSRGDAQSSGDFTVVYPSININTIVPLTGNVGDTVVISGQNFYRISQVKFGDISADFKRENNLQIKAVVPTGVLYDYVKVVSDIRLKTGTSPRQFVPPPVITGFYPATGWSGEIFHVLGRNFINVSNVLFHANTYSDKLTTNYTVISSSHISGYVPSGDTWGTILVSGESGLAGTSSSRFLPVINLISVLPTSGKTGDAITLSGRYYDPELMFTGNSKGFKVEFNKNTGFFLWVNNQKITGSVPTGEVTGPIFLFRSDGTTTFDSYQTFTGIYSPSPSGIIPVTGVSGKLFSGIVYGSHLLPSDFVKFSGISPNNRDAGATSYMVSIAANPYLKNDVLGRIINITGFSWTSYQTGVWNLWVSNSAGTGIVTGAFTIIPQFNIARKQNTVATSSSVLVSQVKAGIVLNYPQYLIDGFTINPTPIIYGRPGAAITISETNAYFKLQFPTTYEISKVVLYPVTEYIATMGSANLQILDSSQNNVYTTAITWSDPKTTLNIPAGKFGQYVKVTQASTAQLGLWEMEVY